VTWHVYYGDVRVGSVGERPGVPVDVDQWQWSCGFYPGLHPGQHRNGTAPSFEEARIGFEADWKAILAEIPEGAFDEWRHQRDFTKQKYASWDRGERMPSQKPSSMMRCPCGEMFDSHRLEHTRIHVPHITATVAERLLQRTVDRTVRLDVPFQIQIWDTHVEGFQMMASGAAPARDNKWPIGFEEGCALWIVHFGFDVQLV
jgi:hypothetical protein